MSELGPAAQRYERLVKGRDLVRRAATLLSGREALPSLVERLATLLDEFVDASSVSVTIAGERSIQPDSPVARVLKTGETVQTEASIFVPISFGGERVGVLRVRPATASAYDDEDRELLETCALYLGACVHDERQRETNATLARLATTDALTGLTNRRGFDDAFLREWRRCSQAQQRLSLAIVDVDLFKRFNDAYGHVAGDACLRQIARALASCIERRGDVVARYGGEEFAFILPEIDAGGAVAFAERVCEAVVQLLIPHEGSTLGYATASIGVATQLPTGNGDPNGLLEAADAMLYAAKAGGRNRAAGGEHRSERLPASSRIVVRYNLPHFPTPLVGREREIAEVGTSLRSSPLVTIAGPGGIGKTRLAVQVALQGVAAQPDGTWFADLAPLADGDLVATTLAAAIGLKLAPSHDTLAALVTLLKPQRLLVVLDNCEHVIEGAARVADAIAGACPHVRILATSREPLNIEGESVYRLGTLDDASACALFAERARRGGESVPLAESNALVIADICRRLDGVALAIELAAARAQSIPLEELRARLDERFRLLTGGDRTGAPRQQSMLASISWSYDLLSERERAIFRRLGVFSGGFTLQAAKRMVEYEDMASDEVVDTLATLIDKSMIAFAGGGRRYRMLESLRQYAVERLAQSGELEAARNAHAKTFAELASEAASRYGYATQDEWVARYEPELDNFRAALDWATGKDLALAARLTGDLPEYWDYCGLVSEGIRRSEAVLAQLEGRPETATAYVQLAVAHLHSTIRAYRQALDIGDRAFGIAEHAGDPLLLAKLRRATGAVRCVLGEGIERGAGDLRDALDYFRTHDNPVRRAGALYAYAGTLDLADGKPLFQEAYTLAIASGWPRLAVAVDTNLAEREFWAGDTGAARERASSAILLLRNRRAPLDLSIYLANLASYCSVAGACDEALAAGSEAVTIARDHELPYSLAIALQSLAVVRAAQGNAVAAARLLGYIEARFTEFGFRLERTEARVRERLLDLLHGQLDEAAFARETAIGQTLSAQDACALGLGERFFFA